jgi:DNA-binding transcriptional regulator YbjK
MFGIAMITNECLIHKVYCLVDSASPEDYRYIGSTKMSLSKRLSLHWHSRQNEKLTQWIGQVRKAGRHVLILELKGGMTLQEALDLETRLIRTLSRLCSLFNRRMLGSSNIVS